MQKNDSRSALAQSPSLRKMAGVAVPMMGLMLCHLGISLTDLWVAGRIDQSVQAALGVVAQIFAVLMLVTSFAGSGCLAAISQSLGAGLEHRARRYAALILLMAGSAGAVTGILGIICLPVLLYVMQVPDALAPVVRTFAVAYCIQLPFYYCLILMNSIFRAYGLVILPVCSFLLVLAANFAGSVGFGLGWWGLPDFGYAGVAWATVASTFVGLACSVCALIRHGILQRASFAPWKWNRRAMPYIFRVGGLATVGRLAEQGGSVAALSLAAALPVGAVGVLAGMTLGMRLQSLLLFPIGALSLTMSIFSGHMLGAGNRQELYRFGLRTALFAAAGFCIPSGLLYLIREPLGVLMSDDGSVVGITGTFMAYGCACVPFTACSAVLAGIFMGTGATRLLCYAGVLSMWLIRLPLAYTLAYVLDWREEGLFAAMLAGDVVNAVCLLLLFRGKKWLEYGLKKGVEKNIPAPGAVPVHARGGMEPSDPAPGRQAGETTGLRPGEEDYVGTV